MIFVLSSVAGGGKSTIARMLLKKMPDLKPVVTYTTRPPRKGEKDGVHYNFVTVEKIRELDRAGELVECTEVHGNWYGAPLKILEGASEGLNDVLIILDYQGRRKLAARFPAGLCSIWLQPQYLNRLFARLKRRHTSGGMAEVKRRLDDAKEELRHKDEYDVVVTNWENQQARTVRDLLTAIRKRRSV